MAYKPKRASGAERIAEARAFGAEPDFGTDLTVRIDYIRALNWYSRAYDSDSGQEWLVAGMTARSYALKQISAAKRSGMLTPTICAIARLLSRDCLLPADSIHRWEQKIKSAISMGQLAREEAAASGKGISPAERNRQKANSFRAEFDGLYDDVWRNTVKLSEIKFFDLFKEMDMKPSQAAILSSHYQLQLDELKDKEVERSSNRLEHSRLTKYVQELVDSLKAHADSVATATKKEVKVSKAKVKKPVALVTRLKFKKIDEETKLVSIDPRQIIGAQMVIIYNAKYKQLAILRASKPEGLSVKGTTILNYDEKTSEAKRAGRHTDTIKQMSTATKTVIPKLFLSIKSTPIEVRSRTSEDTVIVRAIK